MDEIIPSMVYKTHSSEKDDHYILLKKFYEPTVTYIARFLRNITTEMYDCEMPTKKELQTFKENNGIPDIREEILKLPLSVQRIFYDRNKKLIAFLRNLKGIPEKPNLYIRATFGPIPFGNYDFYQEGLDWFEEQIFFDENFEIPLEESNVLDISIKLKNRRLPQIEELIKIIHSRDSQVITDSITANKPISRKELREKIEEIYFIFSEYEENPNYLVNDSFEFLANYFQYMVLPDIKRLFPNPNANSQLEILLLDSPSIKLN